ncbi:tRNA (adenosine(37)-N6)-threonylcarbamoyltransferase complex ATPase subunit type 1 TsaE [bacterium]|nr:tRNA (adenosine(37)-N6)-threonylcarbamoyltransferase complex ATPase subunit type 1 TsaE [bacterium]
MADVGRLFPVQTTSENETRKLGRQFGMALSKGDVVALVGDLGAGKTQFVKGIAACFGIDEHQVSSPTFTIVHEYHAPENAGHSPRVSLYHMDLYRLKTDQEIFGAGVEEYLQSDGICLIEWPERAGHLLPEGTHIVSLKHLPEGKRLIEYRSVPTV